MTSTAASTPEIINHLADGVSLAMAMLAGMELDIFTPLNNGPLTTEEIAVEIGVQIHRLAAAEALSLPARVRAHRRPRGGVEVHCVPFLVHAQLAHVQREPPVRQGQHVGPVADPRRKCCIGRPMARKIKGCHVAADDRKVSPSG